jgi:DNA-binding transcriptional MerR regulator
MSDEIENESENDNSLTELISISRMASIHNISRQTLIHYDHIGLFKPVQINESGYRYYSLYQIPILRDICLMKGLGFSLEEVKEHLSNRTTDSSCEMLNKKLAVMEEEIKEIERRRKYLAQRLDIYYRVASKIKNSDIPYVEWQPERAVLFEPYPTEGMGKRLLHLTLMKAWAVAMRHQILPASGFGSLLRYSSVCEGHPLQGAGSIINIPLGERALEGVANIYTVPAGEYAIMYKYGMPYDTSALVKLLAWIKERNFEVVGDYIVDQCLLDTMFYDNTHTVDFCMLQVPIK